MQNNDIKYYLKISLTLLVICACVAVLLSSVNMLTKGRIEQNELEQTRSAIAELFPGDISYTAADIAYSEPLTSVCEVTDANGALEGYCVFGSVQGFKAEITFIAAIDPDGTLIGVKVISNSETAGLGSKISEAGYLAQYAGKSGTLALSHDVDAVAGATISSRALLEGINAALGLSIFDNANSQTSVSGEAADD